LLHSLLYSQRFLGSNNVHRLLRHPRISHKIWNVSLVPQSYLVDKVGLINMSLTVNKRHMMDIELIAQVLCPCAGSLINPDCLPSLCTQSPATLPRQSYNQEMPWTATLSILYFSQAGPTVQRHITSHCRRPTRRRAP
jgi:hypothetical protein